MEKEAKAAGLEGVADVPSQPRKSRLSPSTSEASSASPSASGPMPLPVPVKRTRQPKAVTLPTPSLELERKALPDDPKEFDKAIGPCRVMVRPVIHGISRLCKAAGTDELDKEEKESGEIAFSALMYQYGAMLDARVLVALWVAGVSIPRITQYLESQEEKRRQAQARALPAQAAQVQEKAA